MVYVCFHVVWRKIKLFWGTHDIPMSTPAPSMTHGTSPHGVGGHGRLTRDVLTAMAGCQSDVAFDGQFVVKVNLYPRSCWSKKPRAGRRSRKDSRKGPQDGAIGACVAFCRGSLSRPSDFQKLPTFARRSLLRSGRGWTVLTLTA